MASHHGLQPKDPVLPPLIGGNFGNGAVGGLCKGCRMEEEALTELWGRTIKRTEPEEDG